MINTDPLTGKPVPCVDHDGISEHVLRDLARNATEKGDGPSAFAATYALHRVLYVRLTDWRQNIFLRPQTQENMSANLEQVTGEIKNALVTLERIRGPVRSLEQTYAQQQVEPVSRNLCYSQKS